MNGFIGGMLGAAEGLMYHPGTTNKCFSSIEGSLMSFDTFTVVLVHIYMPWYWSDLQVVCMDTITMQADFYSSCDIDKVMTTATHLVTVEGLSELGSRALGAVFFEYRDLMTAFAKDEEGVSLFSAYEIGVFVGRAISVTLAWTI